MARIKATHWTMALICAMYLAVYIDRSNIGTAAAAIRAEFGLSNAQLGLIFSAFSYPYAALVLFGGYFADRFGARLTFFVCVLVFSAATILTGLATGLTGLLFARGLLGLGEAPALSTATRAMTNWLPRTRWGFGQGITHSFARIGTAVTPPLVAGLITAFSWRDSFLIVGVLTTLLAIVWFVYFRDEPADHPSITAAELAMLPKIERERRAIPLKRLAIRFIPLILTFFCYGWTLWVYLSWLPSFFGQSFHLDLKNSAIFSAGILLGGVVGDTLGGVLSDAIFRRTGDLRKARTWIIIGAFLAAFMCLLVVLLTHELAIVSIALTAAFFLMEVAVAPLWLITMDVAPRFSGTAGGYLSVGFAASGILSPLAFGYVVDRSGSWQLPFAMSMGLLLVGCISALFLKPDQPFVADMTPQPTTVPLGPSLAGR